MILFSSEFYVFIEYLKSIGDPKNCFFFVYLIRKGNCWDLFDYENLASHNLLSITCSPNFCGTLKISSLMSHNSFFICTVFKVSSPKQFEWSFSFGLGTSHHCHWMLAFWWHHLCKFQKVMKRQIFCWKLH